MISAAIWPWALAGVLLLALVVAIFLVVLLKKAAKASKFPDPNEPEEEQDDAADGPHAVVDEGLVVSMGEAFRRARQMLDRVADGDRHDVPLYLLLGAARSRDNDMLAKAQLDLPWGYPSDNHMSIGAGRGFWFFDRGVVLDLAGDHVLGANGKTADDKGWNDALKAMQELRPKRPADGFILTLSCAELLEAATNESKRTELAMRSGRIFRKLADAQQRLGFRMPTYVVVTGCERLVGFRSFCAGLPEASRGQMLGWSSPYGIESVYRQNWIDEAFAAVQQRVSDVQMEIFAETPAESDWLLGLPRAIASLSGPVRTCLDNVFRPSAYHGALIFRGLYFCGREEMGASEEAMPIGNVAFLRDLLDRKVFVENGLASPTTRTVVGRSRAVRTLQIANAAIAILVVLNVIVGKIRFMKQNDELLPFLQTSVTQLRNKRAMELHGDPATLATRIHGANELLARMSAIDFRSYSLVGNPASWPIFTDFDERLNQSISVAFHELILDTMHDDLEKTAQQLIMSSTARIVPAAHMESMAIPGALNADIVELSPATGTPVTLAAAAAPAPLQMVDDMPELHALQRYVREMRALEQTARTFNSLSTSGDLKDLGSVVQYSFNRQLPRDFFERATLYRRALRSTEYARFDPAKYQREASRSLQQLTSNFYAALYRRNPFAARLQQLAPSLQRAGWYGPTSGDTAGYAELSRQMREVELALSGPELEWAFRSSFDLGPTYNAVVSEIGNSSFFGANVAREVRDNGMSGWSDFRATLAGVQSPLTGPVLTVRNGAPEMRLSSESLLLKYALDMFLGQGFVSTVPRGRQVRSEAPRGVRLSWNPALLDRASAVSQAYDRFREKSLPMFPADLRVSIDQVARERARAEMYDLIADAQRYEPVAPAVSPTLLEEELRADISRFASAVQPLSGINDVFIRLGANESQREVAAAMSAEAVRLLHGVDQLLASEQPYTPRNGNFEWWDGSAPPSPQAWGAADEAELKTYLEAMRNRVGFLATNYARPLLAWLSKTGQHGRADVRTLAAKWQSMIDDLGAYDAKKPGNAVTVLEDYIAARSPKLSTHDCGAATLSSNLRSSESYFVNVAHSIARELSRQCYSLAGNDAYQRYAEISRYFNARLAGRYPFAEEPPRGSDMEADPADVRAFFKIFDANKAAVAAAVTDGKLDPGLAQARQFVQQMSSVRAFFAPFLDAEKPETAPSIDVEPTFRVLRQKEVEGDQIITWSLTVGDESVTNRDKNSKLRWTAGEPLTLAIRWASDAPRVPVVNGEERAVVRDRTVIYEYGNRWSLLTALMQHAVSAETLPQYDDALPVTLGLRVHTQPVDGGTPNDEPSLVFMRLSLLAPGKTEILDVPKFPVRAPRVEKGESL
jgi:type VI secretion system protein ImpL